MQRAELCNAVQRRDLDMKPRKGTQKRKEVGRVVTEEQDSLRSKQPVSMTLKTNLKCAQCCITIASATWEDHLSPGVQGQAEQHLK